MVELSLHAGESSGLFRNYFLYPANYTIHEHYFDPMRMIWRICQEFQNDAFGQLPGPLVLFLDNPDFQSWPDVGSDLTVHCTG
jgi:hypothetical protein